MLHLARQFLPILLSLRLAHGTMEGLMRIVEETKAEFAEKERKEKEKEAIEKIDSVDILNQKGLNIKGDLEDRIRSDKGKQKEAYREAQVETTTTAMYKEVRCEGCKITANLLSSHLSEVWKPNWNENKALEHIQGLCENEAAFPGEYQIFLPDEDELTSAQREQKAKEEHKGPLERFHFFYVKQNTSNFETSKSSRAALRRVCQEVVYDNDAEMSELSVATFRKGVDGAALTKLRGRFEKAMCGRACKSKPRKSGKSEL